MDLVYDAQVNSRVFLNESSPRMEPEPARTVKGRRRAGPDGKTPGTGPSHIPSLSRKMRPQTQNGKRVVH